MSKVFQLKVAGFLDRIGGALIGVIRGGILSGLFILLLSQIPSSRIESVIREESLTGSFLIEIAPKINEFCDPWYPWSASASER